MFDERRHRITAGIDKSYLLEPIVADTKTTTTTKRVIVPSKQKNYYSKIIVPPLQNRLVNPDINGNNNLGINDDPLDRTIRCIDPPKIGSKATSNGKSTIAGATRKLTPAAPLTNVTNQKVFLLLLGSFSVLAVGIDRSVR